MVRYLNELFDLNAIFGLLQQLLNLRSCKSFQCKEISSYFKNGGGVMTTGSFNANDSGRDGQFFRSVPSSSVQSLEQWHAQFIQLFREAIKRSGLNPPHAIVADGKFQKFSTDGNPSDDAGWYRYKEDPTPSGSFGCHRRKLRGEWSLMKSDDFSAFEKAAYVNKKACNEFGLIKEIDIPIVDSQTKGSVDK